MIPVAASAPLAVHAAATTAADNNPVLNISIFGAFVAVTLFIVIRASRNNKTAADYYAPDARSPARRTGSPSPATTCRRRRSSASSARSR